MRRVLSEYFFFFLIPKYINGFNLCFLLMAGVEVNRDGWVPQADASNRHFLPMKSQWKFFEALSIQKGLLSSFFDAFSYWRMMVLIVAHKYLQFPHNFSFLLSSPSCFFPRKFVRPLPHQKILLSNILICMHSSSSRTASFQITI